MKTKPFLRESLVHNLRYLMRQEKLSEQALGRRSHVAQKTINKILNFQSAPTLDTVERLAAGFGLSGWHLLMPNLPQELIASQSIERLYRLYTEASPRGRDYVLHVAEREAEYRRTKP